MNDCKRCGGKGFKSWVTDNGRCFLCSGSGRVPAGIVTTTYEVKYVPSSKARRLGHEVAITAEYTQETEVKGIRAHQTTVSLRIHGVGLDGKAVDQTFTDKAKIEAADLKLAQSNYLTMAL